MQLLSGCYAVAMQLHLVALSYIWFYLVALGGCYGVAMVLLWCCYGDPIQCCAMNMHLAMQLLPGYYVVTMRLLWGATQLLCGCYVLLCGCYEFAMWLLCVC